MRSHTLDAHRWAGPLLVALTAANATPARAQHEAEIVASARGALGTLRDSASLQLNGYFAIGFGAAVRDLTPFQGQHWIALQRFLSNADVDVARPTFLMYLPVGDSLIPIGVAYTKRIAAGAPLPTTLGSDSAGWHSHVFCRNVPGEGRALADGPADCLARGGVSAPNQIAMVHTWTVPNTDGVYAHDNPALPYLATGLRPPPRATRDDRLVGLALGEIYGAKLPVAHRIEIEARMAGSAQALDGPRATLRALTGRLREAERASDERKVRDLRAQLTKTYAALADVYRTLARTPELRARFDVELGRATGTLAHRHM